MKQFECQTLIIGGGIAGLYASLKIVERNDGDVILVTKASINDSNSRHAQGGIVGVMSINKNDSVQLHVSDTLKSGDGLCNEETVEFVSKNSEPVLNDLIKIGVPFDKDENNQIRFTLEGAHSINRILHAGGDATGKFIEQTLADKVLKNSKITVIENGFACELLKNANDECVGAIILKNSEYFTIKAQNTILSTGGLGQLYNTTTNPRVATGDGIILANKANAEIENLEFVQFHPTALAIEGEDNRFLISEALRGEGAKLRDTNGNLFMKKYHPKEELASRDIVTRAIYEQMLTNKTNYVYLDATHLPKDLLLSRFPTINSECVKNGIDITKDFIPVAPAAHYSMGGVKTNLKGETNIKHLYAIGEVASTGLHGANRLASNSLLECVVFADSVSKNLSFDKNDFDSATFKQIDKYKHFVFDKIENCSEFKKEIQNIMWKYAGIERDKKRLEEGLLQINNLIKKININGFYKNNDECEIINMLLCAEIIIQMAISREESRGSHYRTDFPQKSDIAKNQIFKNNFIYV